MALSSRAASPENGAHVLPVKRLQREKDKKFRLLFEEHPQPIWVLDWLGSEFLAANRAAVRMYGYSEEEFRGLTLGSLQSDEESHRFLAEMNGPAHPAPSVSGRYLWPVRPAL